jgi:hypothetical protein
VVWCDDSLRLTSRQPGQVRVRLDTSKGAIVIAVHRDWGRMAPIGFSSS